MWIRDAMIQIETMTKNDGDNRSGDTEVPEAMRIRPSVDAIDVSPSTMKGFRDTNGFKHTNGFRDTNGFKDTSDFRETMCFRETNCSKRHKPSRYGDTENADQVIYPPDLEELDSTFLSLLKTPHHDIAGDHVEEICERLHSFDMCLTPEDNTVVKKNSEHTFEVDVVYRKDKDGDTLLHTALILLETVLAFVFIDMAPSPKYLSMKNLMCQTPLHLATLTNLPDVVRRLVVAGAEVDIRDKEGNTPLHVACRNGFTRIVYHLLEPVRYKETKKNKYEIPYQTIPQDMSIRNYDGLSVLHLAAMNDHLEIIEILIEKDIDINLKEGKAGTTILHYACERGNIKLVRTLLRNRRCNINARAYDGSTPFDLARDRGHEMICMTLAAAGARHGDDEYSDSD